MKKIMFLSMLLIFGTSMAQNSGQEIPKEPKPMIPGIATGNTLEASKNASGSLTTSVAIGVGASAVLGAILAAAGSDDGTSVSTSTTTATSSVK